MRPYFVAVDPPIVDPGAGIRHEQEPRGIQTLLTQLAGESVDVSVVGGKAVRPIRSGVQEFQYICGIPVRRKHRKENPFDLRVIQDQSQPPYE